MPLIDQPVKLKHGAKTMLANRFSLSVQHISRVALRERPARKAVIQAILREAEKFEQEQHQMDKAS